METDAQRLTRFHSDFEKLKHNREKPWREIHRAVHLTRSPCFAYYNKGLDQLLAMQEVRLALGLDEN